MASSDSLRPTEAMGGACSQCEIIIIIIIIIFFCFFLDPVLNSQGRKIMLCKDKIQKQAGMVFTPPHYYYYAEGYVLG